MINYEKRYDEMGKGEGQKGKKVMERKALKGDGHHGGKC